MVCRWIGNPINGPENLRAIGLVIAAMAGFAVADYFVKIAARTTSSAEMILIMGVAGAALLAVLTWRSGQPVFSRVFLARAVLLRNGAEAFGTICLISALALAPLSLVSAITQATPLVVTIGAALFLGETIGPRRWIAVLVGLAGVLLILRPDATGISLGALLALGAVLGLAAGDIATRRVPRIASNLQLATYSFGTLIPTGLIFMALRGAVPTSGGFELAMLLTATACAAAGYYALTAAIRLGDVSLVTPFRYSRLLFALLIGVLLLNERPDAMTLIGAAIVIGSGIYVVLRERQLSRRAVSP